MNKVCERVPLPEAARILGCPPQSVREHMKRGLWDLGTVTKMSPGRYQYHIYRAKLNRLIGIIDEEAAKSEEA